jgi:cytochrome P450
MSITAFIDSTMIFTLMVASAIAFVLYVVLQRATIQDPREPPRASSSIPIIGHVIGLMRSKFDYYVQLSQRAEYDIFTMTMPGQKMYVVTSPELIQAVQKQPKVLAFPPVEGKFASAICGISPEAHTILLNNLNGDEGDWGLSMDTYVAMRGALTSGAGLDAMNRVMIDNIAAFLDDIKPAGQNTRQVSLVKWLRHSVTLATTNSVYGPSNPFKDDGIAEAFWDFEKDLMPILIGVMPSFMARKGLAGREKVVKAFESYLQSGGHESGGMFIQNRYHASAKNGVPLEDIARFEAGGSIALLVNTAPAAFWMLLLVFSYPGLANDIRREVESLITIETSESGAKTRNLDITRLKEHCPLLTSTFQEVLRFRSTGTSIRQVMEDTILQDKWLLKKGNMVQMPSRVVHMDHSVWGTDAEGFEPRRFMKDFKTSTGKRSTPGAFRAFGGGTTLCPGRHFATNEILATVTMFLMRFDMTPVSGEWELPTTNNTNVVAVIMEPDHDIEVNISNRQSLEDDHAWAFVLKDSTKVFAVAAEDRGEA